MAANQDAPTPPATASGSGYPIDWTAAKKGEFLDHLAATCLISAAAAHVGVSIQSVYRLRRRDKRFAAQWAAAVESGYAMLETQLVGHALAGGGPVLTDAAAAMGGPIDVSLAMHLLAMHRARVAGRHDGGPPLKRATAEETDAAILRKLAAMKRGDARQRTIRKAAAT